jgi:hypothetical protein
MYKTINENFVQRIQDGAHIPIAEGNRDYEEYALWLEEGNSPEPADLPNDSEVAQGLLDALERSTMMSRGMREFLLVSMQDLAQRQSEQMADIGITMSAKDILAGNAAWVKLVQINAQATALRGRIK